MSKLFSWPAKRGTRRCFVIAVFIGAIAAAAPGQEPFLFEQQDLFFATTFAEAAQAVPNLGEVAAPHTVGDLTFDLGPAASALLLGTGDPGTQWTDRNAGHDIALEGGADLNIDVAAPVTSLGFEFIEPETDANLDGPFVDSQFEVTLRLGGPQGDVVGTYSFARPNDALSFVGVAAAEPFDRVEIRETTGDVGNEFFGQFLTGAAVHRFWSTPAGGSWNDPANWSGGELPGIGEAVFLAPRGAGSVSIGGPPEATSIGSLQVGDATTPSTTLQIQPFGPLSVIGSAVIGGSEVERATVTLSDLEEMRMHVGNTTTVANGGRLSLLGGTFSTMSLIVRPGGELDHKSNGELVISGGSFQPPAGAFDFGPTDGGSASPVLSLVKGASTATEGLTIGQGEVDISGGSRWDASGEVIVGGLMSAGAERLATLNITDAGRLTSASGRIGVVDPFRRGVVNVRGSGSRWEIDGVLDVGPFSHGTLHVSEGGEVQSNIAVIGELMDGTVIVEGSDSRWINSGLFFVGQGSARLSVLGGGVVETGEAVVDAAAESLVLVEGSGSTWNAGTSLTVAQGLDGAVEIRDGGTLSVGTMQVATATGGAGSVVVAGKDAVLEIASTLNLGPEGTGTLEVQDGGQVRLGEGMEVHPGSTLHLAGGILEIRGETGVSVPSASSFNMTGGTLAAGRFGGSLVQNGGTLTPGVSGDTPEMGVSITGEYTLNDGALQIEIGGPADTQFDRLAAGGAVALGGTLDVVLVDLGDGMFSPAGGEAFDILTSAEEVLGTFEEVDLPALASGLTWDLTYGVDRVTLEVLASALSGDYNNNGRVEQADLDLVLLNWGGSFDTLPADWVNERPTSGIIDQSELDGVLLNWGETSAAVAGNATVAVPEPARLWRGILAAAGAWLVLCTCWNRRAASIAKV